MKTLCIFSLWFRLLFSLEICSVMEFQIKALPWIVNPNAHTFSDDYFSIKKGFGHRDYATEQKLYVCHILTLMNFQKIFFFVFLTGILGYQEGAEKVQSTPWSMNIQNPTIKSIPRFHFFPVDTTAYAKLLFFKVLRHKTIITCNSAIDNKFIDHLQTDIVNGRKMWEYCGDMWVFGYLH